MPRRWLGFWTSAVGHVHTDRPRYREWVPRCSRAGPPPLWVPRVSRPDANLPGYFCSCPSDGNDDLPIPCRPVLLDRDMLRGNLGQEQRGSQPRYANPQFRPCTRIKSGYGSAVESGNPDACAALPHTSHHIKIGGIVSILKDATSRGDSHRYADYAAGAGEPDS